MQNSGQTAIIAFMMNKNFTKTPAFGYFLAVLSVFFWGITFVCTKTLSKDFSALEILDIRFVLAYAGLWALYPKRVHFLQKSDIWLFAAAGFTGVTFYQFAENIALVFSNASNVSVIVSICPIFTAIIAQIFLKEKHISLFFILGFVFAICGVALVSFNGAKAFHLSPKGDFIALLSAVSWGFYSLFVSLINKKGYHSAGSARIIFFFALLFMIPLSICGKFFGSGSPLWGINLDSAQNAARFTSVLNWVSLCFLGLVASAFCFTAWNRACLILGTVKISLGLYLIPVVTIIFAFFALGEKITVLGLCGTFLTIFGLFLSGKKNEKTEQN